jgi:hypothetical protein
MTCWPNQPNLHRLKLKLTVQKEILHGVTVQERVQVGTYLVCVCI